MALGGNKMGWSKSREKEWPKNGWRGVQDGAQLAKKYFEAGWVNPTIAKDWFDRGFKNPEEASKYHRIFKGKIQEASKWNDLGFYAWEAEGFKDIYKAKEWYGCRDNKSIGKAREQQNDVFKNQEEEIAWFGKQGVFISKSVARKWYAVGFDVTEAAEWYQGGWRDVQDGEKLAKAWCDLGWKGKPEEACKWYRNKTWQRRPSAALKWFNFGFKDPEAAGSWVTQWQTVKDGEKLSKAWYDLGWKDNLEEACKWCKESAWQRRPQTALKWFNAGFEDPEEAYQWEIKSGLGNKLQEAKVWHAKFKDPEKVKGWIDAGFKTPKEAKVWHDAKFKDPKKVKRWIDAGFKTPKEAKKIKERNKNKKPMIILKEYNKNKKK